MINESVLIPNGAFGTINLNYSCDLACQWCYVPPESKRVMDNSTASKIIDLFVNLGIGRVFLSGGEPTISEGFISVVRQLHLAGLRVLLNTNGLSFAKQNFLNEAVDSGLSLIQLSLKAVNERDFFANTGCDEFTTQKMAIRNILSDKRCFLIVNINLSRYFLNNFDQAIELVKSWGVKDVAITFAKPSQGHVAGTQSLVPEIEEIYSFTEYCLKMLPKSGLGYSLRLDMPLCGLSDEAFYSLGSRWNILTNCLLREKMDIVFNPDGGLIPCNLLNKEPLGYIGKDFSTVSEYRSFLRRKDVIEKKAVYIAEHSLKCRTCSRAKRCCRGCAANSSR